MTTNKVTGLVTTLRIEMDKRSVDGGEALSLGACIQSLTTEGWHLTYVLEADDGALTAILWRGWDVGIRPSPEPVAMSGAEAREAVSEPWRAVSERGLTGPRC